MEIITVMNYDSLQGITMCKAWFYLMNRFNPNANIKVFYKDKICGIHEFGSRFPNVEFIELDYDGNFLTHEKMKGHIVPSQDLTLATWRWVEEHNFNKFLCVEADAWVLAPLDDLWKIADERPFIGVEEKNYEDAPMVNTGVYSYNADDGFISYTRLMDQYRQDGMIRRALGDQWLVNACLRKSNYDFSHPKVGFEYNCIAFECDVREVNDNEIVIYSATNRPWSKVYTDGTQSRVPRGIRSWSWWGQPRRVKVLHSWYKKFWQLPECQKLWDYCVNKVNEIEHV
jgi:hypothetical protein